MSGFLSSYLRVSDRTKLLTHAAHDREIPRTAQQEAPEDDGAGAGWWFDHFRELISSRANEPERGQGQPEHDKQEGGESQCEVRAVPVRGKKAAPELSHGHGARTGVPECHI